MLACRLAQRGETRRRGQHRHTKDAVIGEISKPLQAVRAFELGIRHCRAQAHAGQTIGASSCRSRCRVGFYPEAAAVERIGRQRHATTTIWSIEFVPIDGVAATIELAQAGQDRFRLASFAERAEPCLCVFIHALPRKGEQGAARADFEEIGNAGLIRRPHCVGKTHGIKRVVAPIFRIRWSLHRRRGYR